MITNASARETWRDQAGFLFAASGSAVGLGNVWKFPYLTAQSGGGCFVLLYILASAAVGIPLLIAELMVGRATQRSPVGAYRVLAGRGSDWAALGWLSALTALIVLSYYSVVGGWTLHYVFLSATGAFSSRLPVEISDLFVQLLSSPSLNLLYLALFLALTMFIVLGGVRDGIERWARILMPGLCLLLFVLLVYSATRPEFKAALAYLFVPQPEHLTADGVLEAVGQSFLSLSVGVGVMLTYGSYLGHDADLPQMSFWVVLLDVAIALAAGVIVFTAAYSSQLETTSGLGLVFQSLPVTFSRLPGGWFLGLLFFLLLVLAAITSAVSQMEVVVSSLIDVCGWSRREVSIGVGVCAMTLGIPSALSAGDGLFGATFQAWTGKTFLTAIDFLATNWMLPLLGVLVALFVGHLLPEKLRQREFCRGSAWASLYPLWSTLLQVVVPLAVVVVLVHATGILD